jgi:hypothetical protein
VRKTNKCEKICTVARPEIKNLFNEAKISDVRKIKDKNSVLVINILANVKYPRVCRKDLIIELA